MLVCQSDFGPESPKEPSVSRQRHRALMQMLLSRHRPTLPRQLKRRRETFSQDVLGSADVPMIRVISIARDNIKSSGSVLLRSPRSPVLASHLHRELLHEFDKTGCSLSWRYSCIIALLVQYARPISRQIYLHRHPKTYRIPLPSSFRCA